MTKQEKQKIARSMGKNDPVAKTGKDLGEFVNKASESLGLGTLAVGFLQFLSGEYEAHVKPRFTVSKRLDKNGKPSVRASTTVTTRKKKTSKKKTK